MIGDMMLVSGNPSVGQNNEELANPGLRNPENAPLGTMVVFPRWQDRHHPRQIAIRWAPVFDRDEQCPWLILGSEGPQRLSHESVEGCEVLEGSPVLACLAVDLG